MEPIIFPCFRASDFVSPRSRTITPESLITVEVARWLTSNPKASENALENYFERINGARAVSTGYARTVAMFAAFVTLACSCAWIKLLVE